MQINPQRVTNCIVNNYVFILEYFQHYEPSHPAPIFIRRTKEMIGMDFYSIVEEILPEAVITLKQFTGKTNLPFR